jgi:tRNA threonylcarbamoyladenosine biosynthesis protein TsaB
MRIEMVAAKSVLAIETSSERLSVALSCAGSRWHRASAEGVRHSEHILVVIQSMLDEAGVTLARLDAVAFGAGPGAFTGVRLGCGVAQGLALARDLPVVAVNSLQALAHGQHGRGSRIVTAIDARLGEVYFAAWERTADTWHPHVATCLGKAEVLPLPDGLGWTGCGNAFAVYGEALSKRLAGKIDSVSSLAPPDALGVLDIALVELATGRATAPEFALPIYVRDKVAMTVAERAERAAGK